MNILVTGGAGFIGSWLCETLVNNENSVICLDNFLTGREDNIKHLLGKKGFSLIKLDVSKPIQLNEKIDYIFHLASPASPVDYQQLPLETIKANSFGTYNVLEFARKENTIVFLASTSEVYGDPKEHPQKETYWGNVNPCGPRSCYDESKRFAETLAINFNTKYSLDVKIGRIFNTYGPRMRNNDGRVIPNFITQAINNKPITIYGDGKQTRSFCFVADMIKGIEKIAFSKYSGEIFNIGNPRELNIEELAFKIIELANSKSEVIKKQLPQDDPQKRKPDITKINELLGWEPKISLKEGLLKTIEYFKG